MVDRGPSLTERLVLVIVGVAVLTTITVGVGAYLSARGALREQIARQLMTLADGRVTFFDQVLADQLERDRVLAGIPHIVTRAQGRSPSDTEAADRVLARVRATRSHDVVSVHEAEVLDLDNIVVASTRSNFAGLDRSHTPAVRGLTEDVPFFVALHERGSDKVDFAVPIRQPSTGTRVGTLLVTADASTLQGLVNDVQYGATGEILVIARGPQGPQYLVRPRDADHDLEVDGILSRVAELGDARASFEAIDARGEAVLAVYEPSQFRGWGIVAKIDRAEAYVPLRRLGLGIFVAGVAACLVGFAVSLLLAVRLVRPIRALQAAATAMGAGNLQARVPVTSTDEVGRLAHAVNVMAEGLSRSQERLRISEERSRRVVDGAPEAILTMDELGSITGWNPRAAMVFGWTAEEAIGRELAELIIPQELRQSHREGLARFRELRDGPILNRVIELTGLRRDGHEFPVEVSVVQIGEAPAVFSGFIRDITDRKSAEARLRRYLADLERSNAELEQFAYVASHDLREPLRMVASYVQLLERRYRGRLDADADEFIGYVVEGSRRMQQMIGDLLEFSRAGRVELTPERVAMDAVLDDALASLHQAIRDSGAVIEREPLPILWGSKTLIGRVFQNLIENAIKYRSSRPLRIRVFARRQEDGSCIAVADNGIGIPPEYHERIFRIFQRLAPRGSESGSGIGLAIAKRIIERHGGRISVDSSAGVGTTFWVCIPDEPPEWQRRS